MKTKLQNKIQALYSQFNKVKAANERAWKAHDYVRADRTQIEKNHIWKEIVKYENELSEIIWKESGFDNMFDLSLKDL